MSKKFFLGFTFGLVSAAIITVLIKSYLTSDHKKKAYNLIANISEKISERLASLSRVTKDGFEEIVENVVSDFSKAEKISEEQAKELKSKFQEKYDQIKDILS